jgi:tetratricopeptide (TPR) repeat protein
LLAALLAPGDPLVTLVAPLAGAVALLLLLGYVGELRRSSATRASLGLPRADLQEYGAFAAYVAFMLLVARGVWIWDPAGAGSDAFEAARAAGVAAIGAGALVLGWWWPRVVGLLAQRLALGLALAGGLLLVGGLLTGASGGPGGGLLGNSGYDMQLLLPGAVIGLFSLGRAGSWREPGALAGGAAFLLAALFAGLTPVLGGTLVLAALGLLALARTPRRRAVGALVGLALLAPLLAPLVGSPSAPGAPDSAPAATRTGLAEDLGGVGVRLAIWGSLLDGDNPLGYGVGQFQAAYPPYRAASERAATTGGQTLEAITEVEHPHSDLLLAWSEGAPLAALIGLVLGLLALGALTLFGTSTATRARLPLAAGAFALVLAGLFHAPLLVNPLAALLGWALLGALAGQVQQALEPDAGGDGAPEGPTTGLAGALAQDRRWIGGRPSAIARLVAPALALVLVGSAFRSAPRDAGGRFPADLSELTGAAALDTARAASEAGLLPQGLLALAARSRQAQDPVLSAALWDLALERRPHSVEALIQRGLMAVLAGDLFGARQRWVRAAELYPGYPPLVANLRRLGADLLLAGELELGLELLAPALDAEQVESDQRRSPAVLLELARLAEHDGDRPAEAAALARAAHWLQAHRLGREQAMDLERVRASLGRALLASPGRPLEALVLPEGPVPPPASPALEATAPPHLQVELAACEAAGGDLEAARLRLTPLLEASADDPEALLRDAPTWVAATVELLLTRP